MVALQSPPGGRRWRNTAIEGARGRPRYAIDASPGFARIYLVNGKARRCIMPTTSRRPVIRPGSLFLVLICCAAGHAIPARAEAVKAAVVAPGRIVRVGNVLSLGTAASGIVADLPVRDGMHVEKGQLLVRIECADLEKELDARKAKLAAVEAVLKRVEHGPLPDELCDGRGQCRSGGRPGGADRRRPEKDGARRSHDERGEAGRGQT